MNGRIVFAPQIHIIQLIKRRNIIENFIFRIEYGDIRRYVDGSLI